MTHSLNQPDNSGQQTVSIVRYTFSDKSTDDSYRVLRIDDSVAVESPLEIRIVYGPTSKRSDRSLSITMRTPGNDDELAAGFLLSEGIIRSGADIDSFESCGPVADGESSSNQLRVNLSPSLDIDMSKLQRHFYTTSSCGVCGKASLDALEAQNVSPLDKMDAIIEAALIKRLPESLRRQQAIFGSTGGLHAAGLFSRGGQLIDLREDVGRHNAVDKLIGKQLIDAGREESSNKTLSTSILVVSGRASFELVQKALVARIPMLVAVGAPSSLAIDLAQRFGLTLVGFNTGEKFNTYCHGQGVR